MVGMWFGDWKVSVFCFESSLCVVFIKGQHMHSSTYEVILVNMSDFLGNAVSNYQFIYPSNTVQCINVLSLEFCIYGVSEVLWLLV